MSSLSCRSCLVHLVLLMSSIMLHDVFFLQGDKFFPPTSFHSLQKPLQWCLVPSDILANLTELCQNILSLYLFFFHLHLVSVNAFFVSFSFLFFLVIIVFLFLFIWQQTFFFYIFSFLILFFFSFLSMSLIISCTFLFFFLNLMTHDVQKYKNFNERKHVTNRIFRGKEFGGADWFAF